MDEIKDLEFLATKSKDIIDKQIASYRQKNSNASSIIAIIALFIPLFLSAMEDAFPLIKWLSIIPIGALVVAICILLFHVLRFQPLDQAIGFNMFQQLINLRDYEQVLLYEIGANKASFEDNQFITDATNRRYNRAVALTIFSIVFAVVLLFVSKFYKPAKDPTEVKIVSCVSDCDTNKISVRIDTLLKRDTLYLSPQPRCKRSNCCFKQCMH